MQLQACAGATGTCATRARTCRAPSGAHTARAGSGYISTDFDSVIGAMGRALFIQHLSSFPIHYLDKDLVVSA